MNYRFLQRALTLSLLGGGLVRAQLPDGPGKEETTRLCSQCHELARAVSLHQDHAGWQTTVNKMLALGLPGQPEEIRLVVDYLSAHYPAEPIRKININKARAIELEAGLSLRRSQSAAVIAYRTQHGDFKSLEDLKKVPGIDAAQIDAKKDRLTFSDSVR